MDIVRATAALLVVLLWATKCQDQELKVQEAKQQTRRIALDNHVLSGYVY